MQMQQARLQSGLSCSSSLRKYLDDEPNTIENGHSPERFQISELNSSERGVDDDPAWPTLD